MELAAFLPLLFVRMSLFALWNASPSRQIQREGYDSENVIDLLEALNVTRGGVRGVSKVKGQEAGVVAWRFRSRTPHLTLPQEHTRYLLSSTHGSLGLHLIGQQTRQTTATLLSLMSHGQMLLRLISCTRSNTLRLEYRTHTHSRSETHKHSDTKTHTLLLPGGSPFTGGGWVQLALGFEAKMVTLFTDCRQEVVVELSQPDEVINLRLPLDLQVTFASEAEEANSKFSGSWQTAEISTRAYQRRPWQCPNLTEPLPPPTSETILPEGSTVPIRFLDEKVGVANDQPQRVVLGAPGKKAQSPTHTPANAEAQTHISHGDPISRLEERLDGVSTMLEMLKNQNMELAERVRYLESCECVRRVCVWEGVEVESGKSWTTDKHSQCICTNGQVQCSSKKDPCSSAPCLNGGVCEVTTPDLGFVCSCPPSAEGRLCEKPRSSVSTQACFMPALKGSCPDRAEPVQRWFHNSASSSCEPFLFSGCHGNANNFLTQQACEAQCMLGACCYRLIGSERSRHRDLNSSSIPEPTTWGTEWAGPGLNASLGVWHNCGSGPISCEHVSVSQCQQKGTAVSFSPGRLCPSTGCVSSRAVCLCLFNGRSFRPGEAFEVGCEACVCTYRGVVECTCRSPQPRKEIRDLSQSEMREYQHAVRTLYLQPDGWAQFARLRAEFVPEANGCGSFLPWHRYFLWSVERALRNASSCAISIPYLEWTVDAGALESSAAWQANMLGGDGDQHNECVWLHPFQLTDRPWLPCLRRHFNTSVSLPDAVTMQLISTETDFLRFSTRLQAASSLFLLWVGGHMATPFCAYDPAFLSHAAFVDRLWEQWQERRALAAGISVGTMGDAPLGVSDMALYPEELRFAGLEPFGVTLEDVRLSSQRLCTMYIPITLGSPCNHTRAHTRSRQTHAANTHTSHTHAADAHNPHTHTTSTLRGEEEEERVFDKRGFDAEGYDRSGYDSMGWNRHGFGRDNYNRDHVDHQGYDSFGFDRYGFNKANLTAFGMRRDGKLLLSSLGNRLLDKLFPNGFNHYGYSVFGLDPQGFDAFGFSRAGVDQDGCNFFFGGPHYLRFYFHAVMNVSLLPLHALTNTPRVCPPISPLPSHWANQNWIGVDSHESRVLISGLAEEWANQRPFQQDYNPNVSPVKKSGLWLPVTPDLRFCFAWQWYSGCPLGSAPVTCPDLCQSAHCRGQPGAVCRMITCGSCHTQWLEPNSGRPIECQDW